MIYSFDIFDTCLARSCGNANHVFDLLAKKLLPKADESQWFDFALERTYGYGRALSKYTSSTIEDVNLHEIYSCCDFSELGLNISVDELVKSEEEIESLVLMPINQTLNMINELRSNGHDIMFISDMYLSYSFVLNILQNNGFWNNNDKLYVSSESRKLKGTGNLFKLIHEDLNIDYKNWVHIGDNKYSDYKVPKNLGIKAKYISHEYTHYEKLLQSKDFSCRINTGHIMAGISRAIRLCDKDNMNRTFAANLIAPIFVPFVYSILKDAQTRGITKLYFLARDAKIFYEIAKEFKCDFPNIETYYLMVSRNSLYLPALDSISYNSLISLFGNNDWQGTNDILARLHMEDFHVPDDIKNDYGAEKILKALLKDDSFITKLETIRNEQRRLCYEYFINEDLGTENCAIVDLNGSRRCHRAINHILSSNGSHEVFGYYLEVVGRQPGIGYKSLNFAERYSKNYSVSPRYLFEQYYCISPYDRTSHYIKKNNEIVPVTEKDPQNKEFKENVYKINVTICREFASLYKLLLQNSDHQRNCEMAISVNSDFYNYPKKDYLKVILNCKQSDSSARSENFLSGDSLFKIIRNKHKYYWLYGEIINSSKFPEFWRWILKFKRK